MCYGKNLKMGRQSKKKKTKTFTNQNFQFHFCCQVIAKYVLVKTEEATVYYSPDGQMVKVSVSQAVPNVGLNPDLTFILLSKIFFTAS